MKRRQGKLANHLTFVSGHCYADCGTRHTDQPLAAVRGQHKRPRESRARGDGGPLLQLPPESAAGPRPGIRLGELHCFGSVSTFLPSTKSSISLIVAKQKGFWVQHAKGDNSRCRVFWVASIAANFELHTSVPNCLCDLFERVQLG